MDVEPGVYEFRIKLVYKDGGVGIDYDHTTIDDAQDLKDYIKHLKYYYQEDDIAEVIIGSKWAWKSYKQ